MNEAELLHRHMMSASTAYRLSKLDLKIDGVPFNLEAYPFLWDIYDDEEHPDCTVMKGAQLGFTSMQVLRTIDRAERMYPRGILYLFPTKDDVSDFSKTRFQRVLDDNPVLGARVRGTDATNVKKVGDCFVYFRGTKARGALKSIPVDAIIYDEFDEMSESAVALAQERISGSKFQHHFRLSTPTLPETRIHLFYLASNRQRWLVRCRGCNRDSVLEDDFPDCVQERRDGHDQVWTRVCVRCGHELYVLDGRWIAEKPQVEKPGWHVSQLCSPTVQLATVMDQWHDPKTVMSEFYNSKLGLPYAEIDQTLDDASILSCCGNNARRLAHEGPSWAGCDVGQKKFFYVAGSKRSETFLRVHAWHTVESEQDVRDLNKRYNVVSGVMDAGAETRTVRNFVQSEPGWWGCLYTEQRQPGGYLYDNKERMVTVNRTESLDESHRIVVQRAIEFPRADETFKKDVMPQLKNLYRAIEVDEDTGERTARWFRKGEKNDDFRHTLNYGVIASMECGVESATRRVRGRSRAEGGSFMSA